jgi:hypothetical protein
VRHFLWKIDKETGEIEKDQRRGKEQRGIKHFLLASTPASSYLDRNCGQTSCTGVLTCYIVTLKS